MSTSVFSPSTHKVVVILDEYLGPGLAANTASVLSVSLGNHLREAILGPALTDASGEKHAPITNIPIPILQASEDDLRSLASNARETHDLYMVDVTDAAQSTKTYDDYTAKLGRTEHDDLSYLGIALCGPKKMVNKLAGSLGLFR
jgi:hypothetical protein